MLQLRQFTTDLFKPPPELLFSLPACQLLENHSKLIATAAVGGGEDHVVTLARHEAPQKLAIVGKGGISCVMIDSVVDRFETLDVHGEEGNTRTKACVCNICNKGVLVEQASHFVDT